MVFFTQKVTKLIRLQLPVISNPSLLIFIHYFGVIILLKSKNDTHCCVSAFEVGYVVNAMRM